MPIAWRSSTWAGCSNSASTRYLVTSLRLISTDTTATPLRARWRRIFMRAAALVIFWATRRHCRTCPSRCGTCAALQGGIRGSAHTHFDRGSTGGSTGSSTGHFRTNFDVALDGGPYCSRQTFPVANRLRMAVSRSAFLIPRCRACFSFANKVGA
jgi:hypothetical protein